MKRRPLRWVVFAVALLGACKGDEALSSNGGDNNNNGGTQQPKAPDKAAPGIRITAGSNITDSIDARPVQALTVTIWKPDSTRAAGAVVRFQALTAPPPHSTDFPTLVASLASTNFTTFAVDTTDSTGVAAVVLGFTGLAAQGRVQVTVPVFGFADTARYTVVAGGLARIVAQPADTQLSIGGNLHVDARPQDRWGNARTDAVTYSVTGSTATVDPSGLVTAVATGVGRVIAKADTFADTVQVTVVPQGVLAAYRAYSNPEGMYRMGVDGSGVTFLGPATITSYAPAPTWDPGGTHLVYASSDRLYIVAAAGGGATRLINPAVAGMNQELSPQIARSTGVVFFAAGMSGAPLSIWRADADGGNPAEVFADPSHAYRMPSPSPDGTHIAVVQDESTIRVLDVGTHTLSSWSVPGVCPEWSPAGDKIAYMSGTGSSSIRVINPDGSQDHQLSPDQHSYNPWTFGWSPDAQWIVAHSDNTGQLELISVVTSTFLPIHTTNGQFFYVSWKP